MDTDVACRTHIGSSGDLRTCLETSKQEELLWIECLMDFGIVKKQLITDLLKEANELLAIFAAAYPTRRR